MPFLLVSSADANDAHAALTGGARVIDAKDPTRGALGPVGPKELARIATAVAGRAPVSAALGDLTGTSAGNIIDYAAHASALGFSFVKGALPASTSRASAIDVVRELSARCSAAAPEHECGVVLAAYADCAREQDAYAIIDVAHAGGARGVLLDTSDKDRSRRLFEILSWDTVTRWVAAAHAASLQVAIAGSLGWSDMGAARETGADIVGVRGAACDGGRTGHVSAARVRALRDLLERPSEATTAPPGAFVRRVIDGSASEEREPCPSFH